MAPRGKKQRAGKPKDSPTSTEGEPEIAEGGTENITEDTESHEEVPKAEDGNGGEEEPPLKKGRGGRIVKKVPGKGKGASSPGDEDKSDDGDDKLPADVGTEGISSKVSGDHDDEEAPPARKGRGRAKKTAIKEDCEVESKEDTDVAPAGAKKGRRRKKKADVDEPEVMPKKRERGAKRNEEAEEAVADEGSGAADVVETKQTAIKEKKQPMKKAGKGKKEDEDKAMDEEIMNGKEIGNGQVVEEQAEEEETAISEDGAGDSKPSKRTAKGKAQAKVADAAAKKKGRGKKPAKKDELSEDNDVPVDGKKLRVLVEHCKS